MQLHQNQIKTLRAEYTKINRVDPAGDAYKGIRKMLDSLSQADLQMLVAAEIKWISRLAHNRLLQQ